MSYMDAGVLSIPNNISDHKATFVTLPFQYEYMEPSQDWCGYIKKQIFLF